MSKVGLDVKYDASLVEACTDGTERSMDASESPLQTMSKWANKERYKFVLAMKEKPTATSPTLTEQSPDRTRNKTYDGATRDQLVDSLNKLAQTDISEDKSDTESLETLLQELVHQKFT
jgi:hypothetical protein